MMNLESAAIVGDTLQFSWIPVAVLLSSFVPGIVIFFLRNDSFKLRTVLNLAGAILKAVLVVAMIPLVVAGARLEWRLEILPGIDLVLITEPMSLLFVGLSTLLWLLTTIYAIAYLYGKPNRSRFFGFFSLCVTASVGIALSGNLITFLIFYEMLTLVTYPLVTHRGDAKALAAGRTYLAYTLSGGVVLLFATVWLTWLVGPIEFTSGGTDELVQLASDKPVTATIIFAMLIGALGVKAALVPLHGWLPAAMVAPAPVSALLHAVAVVKAGVFGIIRVIHDVYGIDVAAELNVLVPVAIWASVTIIYGSIQALNRDDLKERLAYSTVSQVSYVTLGASIIGIVATTGGVVHLVHQGLMKITLFFCAGLFMEVLKLSKVSELGGVGRRMPLTCFAFTVAALGMIGLPPIAGFVSKWYLGIGALDAGEPWVVGVLAVSTLLNAAYFLPIIFLFWIRQPAEHAEWVTDDHRKHHRLEAPPGLLWPAVLTGVFSLGVGVLAAMPYSPLMMAELVAERSYLR